MTSASGRSVVISFLLLICLQANLFSDDANPVFPETSIAAAEQLFRAGKFVEAETAYQALLKGHPKLVPVQVGLVRSMLRQQKIDEALKTVNEALALQDSAALTAAAGDVYFRRGEMIQAETSYIRAKNLDPKEVHAYLGLAKLYSSYSFYRKAYDQLYRVHEFAPNDVEVQRAWLEMLPRKERISALEAYLAGPHPDDEEQTRSLQDYLDFLKETSNHQIHSCRLVSKVEQTETKLKTLLTDPTHVRGIGIDTQLNQHRATLLLDTGAGGILVSSRIAEKADLTHISALHYTGIGDNGAGSGYTAVADHLRIGELEFEDCVVRVSDQHSIVNEDGLIGADVFGAYLVDIDLPGMRLKLSPLPKRPEDAIAPKGLNSEGEEQATAEQKEDALATQPAGEKKSPASEPKLAWRLPRDRYVAPEMANWTKVFRFGHTLLVPTSVNDSAPMLFGLDTGAFSNTLSLRAAQQVSRVSSEERLRIRGVNGEVKKVYSAKANLRFGHLQQPDLQVVTFDLSNQSRRLGTELSGFLGYDMLRLLEVKLDYRDGLVDFEYDRKRVNAFR